jgi:hypothetical protein
MNETPADRVGGVAGILSVILLAVGFALALSDAPSLDASATEVATFFADHQSDVQVGATILGVALLLFLCFLGSLRAALRAAEGGNGSVWGTAYAGGILAAASMLVVITGLEAAAFRPAEVNPELTTALSDVSVVVGAPAAAALTVLLAAAAAVVLRTGVMSAGIGWVTALGAAVQPLAFGAGVTDHGAFAGDGVLGLFVPVIGFGVSVVALSIGLLRPASAASPAAVPPPD